MTREEAKVKTFDILHFVADNAGLSTFEAIEKAYNMGVSEQEPRKGHWIKEKSIHGWDGHSYQCSVCGRSIHLDTAVEDLADYPYCHCGAEMRGEEV